MCFQDLYAIRVALILFKCALLLIVNPKSFLSIILKTTSLIVSKMYHFPWIIRQNKTSVALSAFSIFFFRFDYFRFISFRFSFSRYSRWRRNQVLFLLNVFLNDYKKLMAGLLEINERLCDSFSRASCKTETNETSLTDGDTHMVHLYAAGAMFRQGQYILKEFLTKRIKAFWKIRSNRKILWNYLPSNRQVIYTCTCNSMII